MPSIARIGNIVSAVSAAVVVIVMAVFVHDRLAERRKVDAAGPRVVDGWRQVASSGFARGPTGASHTLVVFSDFECPYCRVFARVVDSLVLLEPGIRVVERHLPLSSIHPFARRAAAAAECASEMGHYLAMRNNLFGRPVLLQSEEWGRLAALSAIADTTRFAECVRSDRHRDRIAHDMEDAERLRLTSTPSIVMDSVLLATPPTLSALRAAIQR